MDYSPVNFAEVNYANQKQRSFSEDLYFFSRYLGGWRFTAGVLYRSGQDGFYPSNPRS